MSPVRPLTKRVPASGFAACGLAILSPWGRGNSRARVIPEASVVLGTLI